MWRTHLVCYSFYRVRRDLGIGNSLVVALTRAYQGSRSSESDRRWGDSGKGRPKTERATKHPTQDATPKTEYVFETIERKWGETRVLNDF